MPQQVLILFLILPTSDQSKFETVVYILEICDVHKHRRGLLSQILRFFMASEIYSNYASNKDSGSSGSRSFLCFKGMQSSLSFRSMRVEFKSPSSKKIL